MAYGATGGFPPQQLPFNKKTKAWRKRVVDFGDSFSLMHYHLARKSVRSMQINFDLLNGKLHMGDIKAYVNPYDIDASFIPDGIQHYPIMNAKLEVLEGEETKRLFDYKVVVTNPGAVSEIEEEKNRVVNEKLQELVADSSISEDEFNQRLEKYADYFKYEYQDKRELRANMLLNHYQKELDFKQYFNQGFKDAYTVGEEIYQCDIVGGEPTLRKLNPAKVRVVRSNISDRIEDADLIVIEDYLSKGEIHDRYWDQLSQKDVKAIDDLFSESNAGYSDGIFDADERYGFRLADAGDWVRSDRVYSAADLFDEIDDADGIGLPYDVNGNIRVLTVMWKSRRKIKKVKSYDEVTGDEKFDFYPETYIIDPSKGEEEETFWVNEAWEGTKIGKDIYINMRPRPIQYNRLSNPSRCHFGIIGSIYNAFGDEPFSLVDMMKPYNYLYDIYHDRLNKLLAKNPGKLIRLDLAKVPDGWDIDKWMYFMTVNGVAVENSFNEGQYGRATGVLAGSMNNASSGVVDGSLGNEITQYINALEWFAGKIGEVAGISKQREGQISNRETVGGVERATLQSSHITEWLFFKHQSVKKRVYECFLETAKIALKGRKKKFEYILSDGSKQIMEIDGDEFAECDYGIVVDDSIGAQELNQKLEMLAQAGLQNQMLDFSTLMKLYTTESMAEKQRIIEACERRMREERQREQEQQMQMQQMQLQQQAQLAQQQNEMQYRMHQEKLETQILTAQINSQAEADRLALMNHDNDEANTLEREKLSEEARQFNEKLQFDRKKQADDARLKEKEIAAKRQTSNKK